MRYYRCKCGKSESWSTDGAPACMGCSECCTTLAQHPSDHKDPVPHDWGKSSLGRDDNGKMVEITTCRRCHIRKSEFDKRGV